MKSQSCHYHISRQEAAVQRCYAVHGAFIFFMFGWDPFFVWEGWKGAFTIKLLFVYMWHYKYHKYHWHIPLKHIAVNRPPSSLRFSVSYTNIVHVYVTLSTVLLNGAW
jgi:hypothetical protein